MTTNRTGARWVALTCAVIAILTAQHLIGSVLGGRPDAIEADTHFTVPHP